MNSIPLDPIQFYKFKTCYDRLSPDDGTDTTGAFADHLRSLQRSSRSLGNEILNFSATLSNLSAAVSEKDPSMTVEILQMLTELLSDIRENTEALQTHMYGAAAAIGREVESPELTLLYPDEEILALIEESFKPDHTLSLGYRDGLYALIFSELINEKEVPVRICVIAVGGEDDYENLRVYLEQFLDLEEA